MNKPARCVNRCKPSEDKSHCTGCGRTMKEIEAAGKAKVDYAAEIERLVLAAAESQSRGIPPAMFYRTKARKERRPLIRALLHRLADLGPLAKEFNAAYVEEAVKDELSGIPG